MKSKILLLFISPIMVSKNIPPTQQCNIEESQEENKLKEESECCQKYDLVKYFLSNHDEINAFLKIKIFEMNDSSNIVNSAIKLLPNVTYNSSSNVSVSFSLSNILDIYNVKRSKYHKKHKEIMEAAVEEIYSHLRDSLKYSAYVKYKNLVSSTLEKSRMSDKQKQELCNLLEMDEILLSIDTLEMSGEIYLEYNKEDMFNLLQKKTASRKLHAPFNEDLLKFVDISISHKLLDNNKFTDSVPAPEVKVQLSNIMKYFFDRKNKNAKDALEKIYKDKKKENKLNSLSLMLVDSAYNLAILDEKRSELNKNLTTFSEIKKYLECEKQYTMKMIQYVGYVLEVKKHDETLANDISNEIFNSMKGL